MEAKEEGKERKKEERTKLSKGNFDFLLGT
jgi:hypothetical protein